MARARVLVVDDSPTILKVVGAILARHGFEPALARDGQAGLDVLRQGEKVDLVLLDFVMPRMNGFQFCKELRSDPALRALPVVLMSAKGDKIRGHFVSTTGAVDAITKPFDARALVAVVEGALAKTESRGSRPVIDGATMPDEDTLAESMAKVSGPATSKKRAAIDFAHVLASAIVPALVALPADERAREASLTAAVARALGPDVLASLASAAREMAEAEALLTGDLTAIHLAEVLQLLQALRQTGVLRITSGKASIDVWLEEGAIDLVQSRGAADEYRLGRYLVEEGLLDKPALGRIVAACAREKKLLGRAVVEAGQVSEQALRLALERQSSELIYEVLRWPFGRFSFAKEPLSPEAEAAKLGLGVAALLLEGFRRVDEWRLMEGRIDFDQVVVVDSMSLRALGEEKLTRPERRVLGAIDGERTIGEVIKEASVGSFDGIRTLYHFLESRIVRPRTD